MKKLSVWLLTSLVAVLIVGCANQKVPAEAAIANAESAIAPIRDAAQKYVLAADGTNDKIWIHNRTDGSLVGAIGNNGRMAGQFHWIDAIAMDSHGNLYTGEVDTGKRVQKFVLTNGDGKVRPRPHE